MATCLSLSLLPPSPTSVFHFSPSSSSSSSSSSTSSIGCLTPTKIRTVKDPKALTFHPLIRRRQSLRSTHHRKSLVLRSSVDDVSVIDPPPPGPPPRPPVNPELIASLKLKLLSAVSGLNRGLAANEDDLRKVEAAAKDLEAVGGPVDLTVGLDKLQGRWKLIYSSAFSGKTLGGSRPGPPTGRLLPITLGQVFQRIDIISKDFDNIVELELGTPWPLPQVEVTATLAHKFEVIEPATIKITFEKTTVKTRGSLSQLPPLELPRLPDGLRPQSDTRRGEFEVTYLDDDTRVTRGDRGELRVFVIS